MRRDDVVVTGMDRGEPGTQPDRHGLFRSVSFRELIEIDGDASFLEKMSSTGRNIQSRADGETARERRRNYTCFISSGWFFLMFLSLTKSFWGYVFELVGRCCFMICFIFGQFDNASISRLSKEIIPSIGPAQFLLQMIQLSYIGDAWLASC